MPKLYNRTSDHLGSTLWFNALIFFTVTYGTCSIVLLTSMFQLQSPCLCCYKHPTQQRCVWVLDQAVAGCVLLGECRLLPADWNLRGYQVWEVWRSVEKMDSFICCLSWHWSYVDMWHCYMKHTFNVFINVSRTPGPCVKLKFLQTPLSFCLKYIRSMYDVLWISM